MRKLVFLIFLIPSFVFGQAGLVAPPLTSPGGGSSGSPTTLTNADVTTLKSNIVSLTLPASSWVSYVGNGADISNAFAVTFTNTAQAWAFADGVTNAIRVRVDLDDWDGQPVKMKYRWSCTGSNGTNPASTNIVTLTRMSLIGIGDREDSLSFNSQRMTNGIDPTAYKQTQGITLSITPGGTLQPTNSLLIELQRLGADAQDTATNASGICLIDSQIYYSRTNKNVFPTSTP